MDRCGAVRIENQATLDASDPENRIVPGDQRSDLRNVERTARCLVL